MPMSSKAFSQYTEQERERWKAVVAQSGIKAD
jgi:hypothetical protein